MSHNPTSDELHTGRHAPCPPSLPGCPPRRLRRWLARLLLSVATLYLCLLAIAWAFSDKLLFPAPPATYADTPEILKIPTPDGCRISATYLHNPKAEYTILYSHGNGEDLAIDKPILQALHDHGFSVLAYDYRGYGTSDGEASERNAYEDAEAAYSHLVRTLHVPPNRIIAHGRSLGGAMAIHIAGKHPIAGLILESTFLSAFRVATQIPITPWDKFPSIRKIRSVRCPVLVMHGKYDPVIPYWHGRQLYDAATSPKIRYLFATAGHEPLMDNDPVRYWNLLAKLLRVIQTRPART